MFKPVSVFVRVFTFSSGQNEWKLLFRQDRTRGSNVGELTRAEEGDVRRKVLQGIEIECSLVQRIKSIVRIGK